MKLYYLQKYSKLDLQHWHFKKILIQVYINFLSFLSLKQFQWFILM